MLAASDTRDVMPSSAADSIELLQGEEILHDIRPAWSKWAGFILISLALSIALVGLFGLAYVWLVRRNTRYIVTNERVVEVTGILGTSSTEYRISDIRQLQTGASWAEGVRGHGNIQISTGTMESIVFDGIPEYQQVANSIRQSQKELEQ